MNRIKVAAIIILCVLLVVCAVGFAVSSGRDADRQTDPTPDPNQPVAVSPGDVEQPAQSQNLSRAKQGWGPGTAVNDRNQPTGALMAQNQYGALGGQFIFPEDKNTIYLSFDLGYENGYTESILDALDARGVKGTFFVTMDYVRQAPEIVQRIIDRGHTLANHTVKHPSIPEISDERVTSEIMELHNYIKENFNYTMTLFRYPKGEFSEYTLDYIKNLGYQSIFWSFAYVDWKTDAQPNPETALNRTLGALHDGAIYLLHAVSSTNAAIMGDFLDAATAKGYQCGLIDQRLGTVQQPDLFG